MKTCFRSRWLAFALVLPIAGCPDEEEGPVGGTDGDQSQCSVCPDDYWVCDCQNLDPIEGCGYDYDACFDYCDENGGNRVEKNGRVACSGADPLGVCTTWDPPAKVDLVSGVYEVDVDFIDVITTSGRSAPLWTCDDATVESIAGGFEIDNASQGELLYELGLRDGDKPQTVNGIDVTTWDGAFDAYTEYLDGETDFTVIVTRNGSPTTLTYELVE